MGTAIAFQEGTTPVEGTPTDHAGLIEELRTIARNLDVMGKLETYGKALQLFQEGGF